jgi:aminopeptidase-like protein
MDGAGSRGSTAFGLDDLRARLGVADVGGALHALAARLYPICRSITGQGVRDSLAILRELAPLTIREIPTGTPVLDWTIPREWNIRDAYVKDRQGKRVIDFQASNLHVVGYSVPVKARMSLAELRPRLHSMPDKPKWIQYRYSYYKEDWGFCLEHERLQSLADGEYEVCIDSTLADGALAYGECRLPGASPDADEVLLSCHVDHPSLANDNLSGMAVATYLARYLAAAPRRFAYRILFLPVTIGAIAWLDRNQGDLGRIRHGMTLSLLGDAGGSTYKRSRRGDAPVDKAAAHVLRHAGGAFAIQEFEPYGYDERQFCSPGFDLPVGCLMRTPHGKYPEYHTSADNLDFLRPASLEDSLGKILRILDVLEKDGRYLNLNPKGEPQLGRRGLYRSLAEREGGKQAEMAVLWVLNQSDGGRCLLDIAERSGLPFHDIHQAAMDLIRLGLLAEAPAGAGSRT